MCFCNPSIKAPYCKSFECQTEKLKRERDDSFQDRSAQYKARMQIMWQFIGTINKATGIEPPEEFFKWFDKNGIPL